MCRPLAFVFSLPDVNLPLVIRISLVCTLSCMGLSVQTGERRESFVRMVCFVGDICIAQT